jgi:hypothetical protein
LACERNPDPTGRLSIPNVLLRVKGYSEDEAVNRRLQMQMRQEVEKLKGNFIRLSRSGSNDHVIHDDDDHKDDDDHGDNDQYEYDLIRGAGRNCGKRATSVRLTARTSGRQRRLVRPGSLARATTTLIAAERGKE